MVPDDRSTARPRAKPRAKRERPAKKQRPRKLRHWAQLEIGSDLWWRALRQLRVARRSVELTLDVAAGGGPREDIDPHSLRPGGSEAESVVSYILLSRFVPTYASFMYVAHSWRYAGRSLKEWIVCQYATMIDSADERWREAALYSLWVDFFEVPSRAVFVFPRLVKRVARLSDLLAHSGPVPWAAKRAAYRAAVANPDLHAGLARGLAGSFFDVMGEVDPVEARDLFHAIQVDDVDVRTALERVLTRPTGWHVALVMRVDETDRRWRKWLPKGSVEPSFLLLLRPTGESRSWVPKSDLVHEGRSIGRLVHWAFPFDPAIAHEVYGSGGPVTDDHVLFRVEGDMAAARRALGCDVEAWPPGLHPAAATSLLAGA